METRKVLSTVALAKNLVEKYSLVSFLMPERGERMLRNEVLEKIKRVDGLLCTDKDKIDEEIIKAAEKLKAICTLSTGYEHIDIKCLHCRGIQLANIAEKTAGSIAELAVGLLLSISRKLFQGVRSVRAGTWCTWKFFHPLGTGLQDKVVGIIGGGHVAKACAQRLFAFSVARMLYCNQFDLFQNPIQIPIKNQVCENVTLSYLLEQSDIVIVCCDLNKNTRRLLGRKEFQSMKSTAILVNVAHGSVIRQDDLYEALDQKVIAGAGLDVTTPEPLPPNSPLLNLPQCVVLPHIGSKTTETVNNFTQFGLENVVHGIMGEPMSGKVELEKVPHRLS